MSEKVVNYDIISSCLLNIFGVSGSWKIRAHELYLKNDQNAKCV